MLWLKIIGEWFLKFGSGFLPIDGEKIGKLLWVGLIALGVAFAFNFFQKPTNIYSGTVKQIYTESPKSKYSFFGCNAGHIRGGLQWGW